MKRYKRKNCIMEIQNVKKIYSISLFIEGKGMVTFTDLNINIIGNLGLYDVIRPNKVSKK